MKKLLEEWRNWETEPNIKLLFVKIDGIVRLLLSGCGSPSTKSTIMLFRIRKCSRKSHSKRSSVGRSVQVRSTPTPFHPPFWHLIATLVEAMSHLADILKHEAAWDLHDTTPIVRNNYPAPLPIGSASDIQQSTYVSIKPTFSQVT